MPHELKGREIFAVGTFNDIEFNDADLDDIVANFDRLKDTHKVPLKLGHNKDQKITDGQPAIGWISRVFKVGEKLFADFSDMPKVVFEAIKNKLYRTVSIELLFNVDNDGKKFNHVLDAVALLGADIPAVRSLDDLDALLATRTSFTGGHRVAFETTAGTVKKFNHKSEVEMDKSEINDLISAAVTPLKESNIELAKDLKAANEKIVKFTSDATESEKKIQTAKVSLARKAVTNVLDIAVKSKALTPALRETYEKQIGVNDDDRVLEIKLDEVKTMFSIKDADKHMGLHKTTDDLDSENPESDLLLLVRKNQADTGEASFAVAFNRVAAANPTLHLAYLNANGGK